MNPLDDEDDEINNTDENNLTQSSNPKDILNQYLMGLKQKRDSMNSPEVLQGRLRGNNALATANDQGNLAALVGDSIAKAGSVGGVTPNTSALQNFAKNSAASNSSQMAEDNQIASDKERNLSGQEKIAQYLIGKQQNEDLTKAKMNQSAQQFKESQQNKREIADQTNQTKKDLADAVSGQRSDAAGERSSKQADSQFDQFSKRLSGNVRDSIGNEKAKLRTTTHALAILDGMNTPEDFNKLSPMQVKELGAALATTLSPGSPALTTIQEMTPHNAARKMAELSEYFFSEPAEANQGKFVDMYKHMLERQKDVSSGIIQGEISPIVANYRHLYKQNPERFKDILNEYGADIDQTGKVTAYQPPYQKNIKSLLGPAGPKPDSGTAVAAPNPASHPQANQAVEWAKKNPNDPRSAEILKRIGGQ